MWCKSLPDLIYDSKGFDPSEELPQIKASCIALSKEIGFEEVESEDIEELLQSHAEALSTQEPQQLDAEAQMEAFKRMVQFNKPPHKSISLLSYLLL